MLAEIDRILEERELLAPGEEVGVNINLISAEQATLQAFTRNGGYLHTRVKQRGLVPDEYDRCLNAWRTYPQYAPRPLERRFSGQWEIILVEGVPHTQVRVGTLANNGRLTEELLTFFAQSAASAVRPAPSEHRAFLRRLCETTAERASAAIIEKWLAVELLDDLRSIPQHGDFTVNNLGLRSNRLVIFDWEDFGKVALPGFDICTLIASDLALSPERLAALTKGNDCSPGYAALLRHACALVGLTPDFFIRLIPVYLAIFLDLKREYGEPIRLALRHLIERLPE